MSIDRALHLKNLHLYGMAAAWGEWQAEVGNQQKPVMPEVWLDRLIAAEQADRQARSLNYQLKAARFPIHRDLLKIDWVDVSACNLKPTNHQSAQFSNGISCN